MGFFDAVLNGIVTEAPEDHSMAHGKRKPRTPRAGGGALPDSAEPTLEKTLPSDAGDPVAPIATAEHVEATQEGTPESEIEIIGHLDGLEYDWTICGWAYAPSHPNEAPAVEIFSAGRVIALGLAEEPRPDVAEAGLAAEGCGFRLTLPDSLFDGRDHEFEVWVSVAGQAPRLFGATRGVLPKQGVRPPAAIEQPIENEETDSRHGEVDQARTEYLEDILAIAHSRVDELENSERALHAEVDGLRRQLDAFQQQYQRQVAMFAAAPHRLAPGAFDGSATRMFSLSARRDAWLTECSSRGVTGAVYALSPHDGLPGPMAILVWGSGGIGDALYLTTVVRELNRLFQDCVIVVLHENGAAEHVLGNNPYVAGVVWLQGETLQSFVRACHSIDVFDLIVEVRYAITYSAPPLSRVPADFLRAASYRAADWQPYVRYRWPHLNNVFAKEVSARGMSKLDLVGFTSMLPIDADTVIDYFMEFADHVIYPELANTPFVTIHHGSDKRMASLTGQQTKNLPLSTWNEVVSRLRAVDLRVVQLGEAHEELVPGVDYDFRGRTTLEQTAYLLKTASVHIDTEGGIVHLARSVNTPSVVAFGPTPVGFFGYASNRNLAPPVCGDCWWTTETWAARCPRGLSAPECMLSHSAETLVEEARALAARSVRRFDVTGVDVLPLAAVTPSAEGRMLDAVIGRLARRDTDGLVVIGPERRFGLLGGLTVPLGRTRYRVPATQLRAAQQALSNEISVEAYSAGNMCLRPDSVDWCVALGFSTSVHSTISTLTDLAVGLKPGGTLVFTVDSSARDRTAEDVVRTLIDTNRLRPGCRFTIERGPEIESARLAALETGRAFMLTVRRAFDGTAADIDPVPIPTEVGR